MRAARSGWDGSGADAGGSVRSPDVEPLLAASAIVLRGESPFEVLMVRRNDRSSFVPGAWVFPGGGLDPSDGALAADIAPASDPLLTALRICALREMVEESGVWAGPFPDNLLQLRNELVTDASALSRHRHAVSAALERLVWTSRWITPAGIPKRFDTYFFLAAAGTGSLDASPDHGEAVDLVWITPGAALDRYAAGDFPMVFPTLKNLEALVTAPSASALLRSRLGAEVPTHQPVLVIDGGKPKIVLPAGS